MWKKKNVGKRRKTAEGIFLSKEEKSEKLGQFWLTSLQSIDWSMILCVIAKPVIDFVREKEFKKQVQKGFKKYTKAGMP